MHGSYGACVNLSLAASTARYHPYISPIAPMISRVSRRACVNASLAASTASRAAACAATKAAASACWRDMGRYRGGAGEIWGDIGEVQARYGEI